jgi:hypothetical protein
VLTLQKWCVENKLGEETQRKSLHDGNNASEERLKYCCSSVTAQMEP